MLLLVLIASLPSSPGSTPTSLPEWKMTSPRSDPFPPLDYTPPIPELIGDNEASSNRVKSSISKQVVLSGGRSGDGNNRESPLKQSAAELQSHTNEILQAQISQQQRAMSLVMKNRKRKGSLRKVILNRGASALRERRESRSGGGGPVGYLTIDTRPPQTSSHHVTSHGILAPPAKVSSMADNSGSSVLDHTTLPLLTQARERVGYPLAQAQSASYSLGLTTGASGKNSESKTSSGLRLPPGTIAAAQAQARQDLVSMRPSPSSAGTGIINGMMHSSGSGGIDNSTTDEDEPLQLRVPRHAKSPLSFTTHSAAAAAAAAAAVVAAATTPPGPGPDWDYGETELWGWVVLLATWFIFVIGMGSSFGVWAWAWDVGTTPYAPPEFEDDPTLPITGYYPALLLLSGVMAWIWVLVAWVGMKYFRHAKISGD